MPFDDFDDSVMMKIEEIETVHEMATARKAVVFSWISFAIGAIFGVLLTFMSPRYDGLYGLEGEQITYFIQIVVVVSVLFQFDKLLGTIRILNPSKDFIEVK